MFGGAKGYATFFYKQSRTCMTALYLFALTFLEVLSIKDWVPNHWHRQL